MSRSAVLSRLARLLVFPLLCYLALPLPMNGVAAISSGDADAACVHARLNSPERAAAMAEAARLDAAARESHGRGEAVTAAAPAPREEKATRPSFSASREAAAASRPQSVTEVPFNYAAGFADVPGLYEELHYDLWGRNAPTRGGRSSGSGAYGGGYSRDMSDFDPLSMAVDRGLNYGSGLLNSAGEAVLSGFVGGGRARLNFRLDRDGYFNGEGDVLLPLYDGTSITVYTQFGARSMHDSDDTRWIGNFGLGQRWFPFAEGDDPKSGNYDAGVLMLGYNAFFDYGFTRDHQRGGIGVEVWYDWLRVSSNYYFPLSDWKGSGDFDSRFVKERPAGGWDVRVKACLPFYRHVAVTGAYSQWYGNHVGMFGALKLEKDPKVWSYGVEYTPIPLVSGFVTQRSTERGRTDTEFGLNFTCHFQMPWEEQITPAKVAELRTLAGARHEFVGRENRIILEYKARNAYRIEYLGMSGSNVFRFRIRDGFDIYRAGQTVRVFADGVTLAASPAAEKSFFAHAGGAIVGFLSVSSAHAADFSQIYTTDGRGEFLVTVSSLSSGPVTLAVQAGGNTQSFTVNVTGTVTISIDTVSPLPNATVGANYSQSLAASGGTGPYSFAVTSGSLSGGLGLSGSAISGMPTVSGTFTFTITATDSKGVTADKQFSLTVNAAVVYGLTQTPPVSIAVGETVNSVAFILAENGVAVADTTPVSLSYSGIGAFSSPPVSAKVSGGNGGFTVSLTGRTAGSVTVTATFGGGRTATATMTVNETTYTVSVSPSLSSIKAFESTTFTATIQKNSSQVPDNETVTWTVESGSGSFTDGTGTSPTSRTSATSGGAAAITLQAAAVGAVTIKASIGGASGQGNITVTAAAYAVSLTASDFNPNANGSSVLTATVTRNGSVVSGEFVAFTWKVTGGSQSVQTGETSSTNDSGGAAYTVTGTGDHRTISVTAMLQSDMSRSATAEVQFGPALSSGFIALHSGTISWNEAGDYCASQGGQLPAKRSYSYAGTLPYSTFWSRREHDASHAYTLYNGYDGLNDYGSHDDKSVPYMVVCVP